MKLIIADDHILLLDALEALLKRDLPEVDLRVAERLDPVVAELTASADPAIVVLDLRMPGMRGISSAAELARAFPHARVVLMSGYTSSEDVQEAIRAGLWGFLPKTLMGAALASALRLIEVGERYFPALGQNYAPEHGGLSRRERQVLLELRLGRTNKEIAQVLRLEEATVKTHVRALRAKLGARNRTEIALRATELLESGPRNGDNEAG